MNILLSRILTYINGTLFNDFYYKIGMFIISHYIEMENMSKEDILEQGPFREEELNGFVGAFGFDSYEEFQFRLYNDYQTRLNQIRIRLFDKTPEEFLKKMEKTITDEEMKEIISDLCERMYKANRIIIFGALYPLSISVELQTDMITFGKTFIQHHTYDPVVCDENDICIFVSGTGRSMDYYIKTKPGMNIDKAYNVLITQNKKYLKRPAVDGQKIIVVPGKYESVEFNYQIMSMFDLIRLRYFQQYYL